MLSISLFALGISACGDGYPDDIARLTDVEQASVENRGGTGTIRSAKPETITVTEATPVAYPVPSGDAVKNFVDTAVSDMRLRNDFILRGYDRFTHGWYVGPGETIMGNNPSFSNSPTWSIYYNNPAYAGVQAKAILPWLVVADGVNHAASNTAVEMRNVRAYVKSRATGKWISLGGPSSVSGKYYGKPDTGLPALSDVVISQTSTSAVVKIHENSGYFWHGWWKAGRAAINPNDIAAVFVTAQARTVVADPTKPDDRSRAQLGLHVAADYYLDTNSTYKEPYNPAVGVSRTKLITRDWQSFSFTTLSDVGGQNPGGGISEAEFRASPPPLE